VSGTRVRLALPSDRERLARLRAALWPDSPAEELARELAAILAGAVPGTLPLVVFVAQVTDGTPTNGKAADGTDARATLAGFVEVGLRSHSDGCEPAHPVGYVEGWYVAENFRRQGIGATLLRAAEDWARSQGCSEMASDTQIENHLSQRVHAALGFEAVERSVIYRKRL
jgi:aminoglycoside 6'-N-acetyltransferase I